MLIILGWVIYSILTLITISFLYGIIKSILIKKSFTYSVLIQTILFIVVLTMFYFNNNLNKLHIIWLFPLILFGVSFLINNFFINKSNV